MRTAATPAALTSVPNAATMSVAVLRVSSATTQRRPARRTRLSSQWLPSTEASKNPCLTSTPRRAFPVPPG
uniref:Putative secreted protein n=1 Tax=Ixodes scapularis TaxID=6945 RepID=A0A4D5RDQ6_IXOSC